MKTTMETQRKSRCTRTTSPKASYDLPKGIRQRLADANDRVYTTQSLADEWGVKRCSIQKRIQRGQLPAHWFGRWFLLQSEIAAVTRAKQNNRES